MTDERKLKVYLYRYKALGKSWTLDIPAHSLAEANHRVSAISSTVTYDGIMEGNPIPAGPGAGFLMRTLCFVRNTWTVLTPRQLIVFALIVGSAAVCGAGIAAGLVAVLLLILGGGGP